MRLGITLFLALLIFLGLLYASSFSYQRSEKNTTNIETTKKPETRADVAKDMERIIKKQIVKNILERKIHSASVYFSSLQEPDQVKFVVNGDERYSPASMAKAFLMVEFLKLTESDPQLSRKMVTDEIAAEYITEMNYEPEQTIVSGQQYSLADINERMIVYSDNKAYVMLAKTLGIDPLDYVFAKMGIAVTESNDDYMTVVDYAELLHILYGEEYLNKANSVYAIDLLSKTKFKDGIVKGVSEKVRVAHKFGERMNDEGQQLHDCGIVYHETSPYVLCVMTRGNNIKMQADVIASVSRTTYNTINRSSAFTKGRKLKNTTKQLRSKNRLYNGKKKKPIDALPYISPLGR